MPKRVYELARDLGTASKVVISRAADLGILVRSASSPVSDDAARRILESFGEPGERVSRPPRSSASGWRAGAIKPPADEKVGRAIDAMCSAFPTMAAHRRTLRRLGSEIVYAGYAQDAKFNECAIALVRLIRD